MLRYALLLADYLEQYPNSAMSRWEGDIGDISGDQWEEAMEAVRLCSMNVSNRLSQLYILLTVHFTPDKLQAMDLRPDPTCPKML